MSLTPMLQCFGPLDEMYTVDYIYLDREAVQGFYFLVLLVLLSLGSILSSVSSKKCPAAVSATVITGTQMALGYVVDVLCTLDVNFDEMFDGLKKPHKISNKINKHEGVGSATAGDVDPRFQQGPQAG